MVNEKYYLVDKCLNHQKVRAKKEPFDTHPFTQSNLNTVYFLIKKLPIEKGDD